MATTTSSRRKVTTYSLISLFLTIIPIVLEFINQGEPSARVDLTFDEKTQRLKAKVSTSDRDGSVARTTSQFRE